MQAMKKNNPKAVWVAQAWQANPRSQMIENLKAGDMIVLDLFSESRPQWGSRIYLASQRRFRPAQLDLLHVAELRRQCRSAR